MLPLSSVVAPKPHRAPSPRDHNGNVVGKSHSSNSRHTPKNNKHKFSQSQITNIGAGVGGGSGNSGNSGGGHRFSGTSGMAAPSLPIAITNNWQKSSPQLRGSNGASATVGSPRVTSPSSPSFATAMLSGSPQQAAFLRSMISGGVRRESVDEHELAAREIMGIMHNNTQPINIPSMRGINARAPSTPLPPINRSSFLAQIQQSNASVGLFFSHASSAFSQAAPILINKNTINNNNHNNNNPNNTNNANNNSNNINNQNTNPLPSSSHTTTTNNNNSNALLSQSPTTSSMTLGTSPSLAAMSPPMRSANPVIRDAQFHFERENGGSGLGLGLGLGGVGGGFSSSLNTSFAHEMDGMASLRLDDPHGMPRVDGGIDDDNNIDDSDDQIDPVSVSMSAESDTLVI